jgi:hypothetical protein
VLRISTGILERAQSRGPAFREFQGNIICSALRGSVRVDAIVSDALA